MIEKIDQLQAEDLIQLQDKAFQLLPHYCHYNDKREVIGIKGYSKGDLDWSYEEFMEELDWYRELEDADGIKHLDKKLERLENGISLVVDVSEFPEPDWIVEGFIVRHGLTLLYGDSGTGKTTLCLYLADAMQKHKDFFGVKCKGGDVIFVENDESGELLRSHRDKVGLPEKLPTANCEVAWDASKKEFNKEFADMLYYYTPDVVVIDAYTSLGIPDITRPESALVLDEFRRLAEDYDCAFVIIHHPNLSGGQMGSSLHRAKMDSIVSLAKVSEEEIMLSQEKVRGSKFDAKFISFNTDTLEMEENTTNLRERVQQLAPTHSVDELVKQFPKARKATIERYHREFS